jgi:hypothetical protein
VRTEASRWQALVELDAVCGLACGLSEESLVAIYSSQFPVLAKYEMETVFDALGRQIAGHWRNFGLLQAQWEAEHKAGGRMGDKRGMWQRVQDHLAGDPMVNLGPFVPPFRPADRETAMRRAYRAFEARQAAAEDQDAGG